MYQGKSFLAIIPARGGSKRLPRKNLLDLNGKPLIAWSIESGLKSEYIDKVVVTSDDDAILSVAESYGVLVINRPVELASDTATTFDVIKHAITKVDEYDYIVLLQPTSPLRNEMHVDGAIQLLETKNADAVISVSEMGHSPFWSNRIPVNGDMSNFLRDDIVNKRSQDLEAYFRLNGAIYICKANKLIEQGSFFLKNNIFAYKMDKIDSIDIDEEIDYLLVKELFKKNSRINNE
jgi:CMP-N,N'-diacetyllegionaminic acid synthase